MFLHPPLQNKKVRNYLVICLLICNFAADKLC